MEKINCNLVNFSICLTDLEKKHLKKAENGKIYLNACIGTRKEADKFGNDLNIFYNKTKEERAAGAETCYVPGNANSVTFDAPAPPTMTDQPISDNDETAFPWHDNTAGK
jgi:hypothetical protein